MKDAIGAAVLGMVVFALLVGFRKIRAMGLALAYCTSVWTKCEAWRVTFQQEPHPDRVKKWEDNNPAELKRAYNMFLNGATGDEVTRLHAKELARESREYAEELEMMMDILQGDHE